MNPNNEPEWLKSARESGLTITETGVNMTKLAAANGKPKPVAKANRRPDASKLDEHPPKKKKNPEKELQEQVVKLANLNGWRVCTFLTASIRRANGSFYHATPFGADGKGFPDLLMVRGTRILAAELKATTKERPEQLLWLAALKAANLEVHVWRAEDWPLIEKTLG